MKSTSRPITLAASVQTILLASTLSVWSVPTLAQTPAERLTDRDIQAADRKRRCRARQVRRQPRRRFQGIDAADRDRRDKGRGRPAGLSGQRQEAQGSIHLELLRQRRGHHGPQAVQQHRHLHERSPLSMKGRSEWDRQSANLKLLAEAYGTTFPMPDGAPVRRMNDKEMSAVAAEVASAANRFKDDLGKVTTLPKPDRDAARKDVDLLVDYANNVKDRTGDSKPSTAEVSAAPPTGGQGPDVHRRPPDSRRS